MLIWTILIVLVIVLLAFDLIILNKRHSEINNRKAAIETAFWISIALSFTAAVYWIYAQNLTANSTELSPQEAVIKYITGYLIELSLSVDNLFVIATIFAAFKIPLRDQHRALFWGILGAIVFRGLMIGVGVILIERISWMTYVFGAFLIFTAVRMLVKGDEEEKADEDPVVLQVIGRYVRISRELEGDKFFTIQNGVRVATPLFGALIMIEITDLLFALDSIPAILGVTTDPFLVFSSNIFAILGLRAMYFFLANMLQRFYYLKYSVFAILIFVGVKLLLIHYVHIPEWISLGFIALSLLAGILISLRREAPPRDSVG